MTGNSFSICLIRQTVLLPVLQSRKSYSHLSGPGLNPYQFKGQQSRIGDGITDGAYDAMMNAIRNDEMPSFYFMQYELATWRVKNLLLIPSFAFPPSAIIKRKPLSPTARRAGWVGCNFALNRIPADVRISVVTESTVLPASEVRAGNGNGSKRKRVSPEY